MLKLRLTAVTVIMESFVDYLFILKDDELMISNREKTAKFSQRKKSNFKHKGTKEQSCVEVARLSFIEWINEAGFA